MTRHADVMAPRGRIAFVDDTGQKAGDSPGHATAVVLWGATAEEVAAVRPCFPGVESTLHGAQALAG